VNRMAEWIWVAAGGALGSALRYGSGIWLQPFFGDRLPWVTLMVNALGSLVAGIIWALCLRSSVIGAPTGTIYYFGLVGFCGGFTTFSAFSRELFLLLQNEHYPHALLYILLSIGGGIVGFWLGLRLLSAQ